MPAIFLNAPAVLERQLTAYCLDRWIASTPSASIPKKMDNLYAQLFRETKEEENQGVFPKAFYRHIELNLTDLIGGFLEMFDREELDQASADYLQTFIQGDDLGGFPLLQDHHCADEGLERVAGSEEEAG